jgi:hypothetical protein
VTLTSTAFVDIGSGEYMVQGAEVENPDVDCRPYDSWGTEDFGYFYVDLPFKMKDGIHNAVDRFGNEQYHIKVRVRIDLTSAGRFIPVGKDKYVEISSEEAFYAQALKTSEDA